MCAHRSRRFRRDRSDLPAMSHVLSGSLPSPKDSFALASTERDTQPEAVFRRAQTSHWESAFPPMSGTLCSATASKSVASPKSLSRNNFAIACGSPAGLQDAPSHATAVSNAGNPRLHLAVRLRQTLAPNYKCHESRRTFDSYLEDLHHLVAKVIDDLHGDAARLWLVERARGVAMQRYPRFLVDFCLESSLQSFVRIVRA